MTPQEMRKLSRAELLEIIMLQSDEMEALKEENILLQEQKQTLQDRMEERTLSLDHAGNIAEASLAITEIFREAEKAVAIYKENIARISRDQEALSENRRMDVERQAAELLERARREADAILAQAEERSLQIHREADAYWETLSEKLELFYRSHVGLRELVRAGQRGNYAGE